MRYSLAGEAIPNIHTVREKRIFIGINLQGVLVAILHGVISSAQSILVGWLECRFWIQR